jgi:hypothetical protein
MPATVNKNLCWKCEELVHPKAVICPYCGSDLHEPLHPEDSSLKQEFDPPYTFVAEPQENHEQDILSEYRSPYQAAPTQTTVMHTADTQDDLGTAFEECLESERDDMKELLLPMALLFPGVVFFLFGLAMFLYSHDGIFTLHWNGNYWPFYVISSVPLMFFGWRALDTLD